MPCSLAPLLLAATTTVMPATSALAADAFPSARPITLVVPFPPGGPTDAMARRLAEKLREPLKQNVIVENRSGAGGNIGSEYVAAAKPDGYTILFGTSGPLAINVSLYKNQGYNPETSFAPIIRLGHLPNILVVNPSVPANNVQELIAYAKQNPTKLSYASSGNGASSHLAGILFNKMAGTDIMHIPYKGSAPAVSDLLGNQIAVMFDNMPSAIQHVRSGKLRPIAVTTAKRSPELPDVPTIAEAGVPGYEATSWFGLWAPAATPAPVLEKLHTSLAKVLKDPAVVKKIADQGGEVVIDTPAQFEAFIQAEAAKWGKVVKDSGAEV
ncbi:MAG: Bug family tripartite tricarboxylate transporter substrate binding protein [Alcaligenes sp.]